MEEGLSGPIERVQQGIETLKKGGILVLIDEEDRENEGDLVYAGVFSTPEKVNFLAKEGRGLICTALTPAIAHRLNLELMVQQNNSTYETAFTVSVDAKECTTGISAFERDLTIRKLADPTSTPDDFKRPGHIFPLIAKEGGVLVRTGHTEGSVDLCRLAGLYPVAVICEIMNPDGTMARRRELSRFAEKHNLPILYISDIVQYRLQFESLVEEVGRRPVELEGVRFLRVDFRDHLGRHHTALLNAVHKTTNLKVFRVTSNVEFLLNPEQYRSFKRALEFVKFNSGVILFLETPGGDRKELGIGAQILKKLGVHRLKLLEEGGELSGLKGFGLEIVGTHPLQS
ncbi:MAG: bifunctional 3,4-dihydroxy-2-butanone 4-phosphate synthase/GTP cyclohydrolase II [Campylobacterales bacterium]